MKILLVSEVESFPENFHYKNAQVIHFPTIKTVLLDFESIDPKNYDILIFTSSKAVRYFFKKEDYKNYKKKLFIAVGDKTKKILKEYGFINVMVPQIQTAQGVVNLLKEKYHLFKGKKILFPRAKKGRTEIIDKLNGDFFIYPLDIYDTVLNIPQNTPVVKKLMEEGEIKGVCFTSPSSFKNFCVIFKDNIEKLLEGKVISAIGKTTKSEVESFGFSVDLVPEKPSLQNLLMETIDYIASRTST